MRQGVLYKQPERPRVLLLGTLLQNIDNLQVPRALYGTWHGWHKTELAYTHRWGRVMVSVDDVAIYTVVRHLAS